VLERGGAGAGGAKSTGAMIPLLAPLVDRLKYLRSICGEIKGSAPKGAASGWGGVFVTAKISGAEERVAAAGAGLASVSAAVFVEAVDAVEGDTSGGGRAIRTKLVPDGAAGRKRKAAGPTAGK
jgi:hypothetical protein